MWDKLRLLFRRKQFPPERLERDASLWDRPMTANPGYALGQLSRALRTSTENDDPEVRTRALRKVRDWHLVLEGMLAGDLEIASRTPVVGLPEWVTLRILTGGFATRELAAGGPLGRHEEELLDRLHLPCDERARAALNAYFLSDAGLSTLREMLHDGRYRVGLPEEGALLAAAWLADHRPERLSVLLDAIAPLFGRVRFYPMPSPVPLAAVPGVHVQPVGRTMENLAAVREPAEALAQREALAIWAPMFDRIVTLFLDTMTGDYPSVATGADGRPLRRPDGSWPLAGGWPCQRFPETWLSRAGDWLMDYRRLRAQWSVARNGAIIEQEQILTTHNLAVLVDGLGLVGALEPHLPLLARRCFTRICRQLRIESNDRHQALLVRKNSAYAWRQMVFFISLVTRSAVDEFLAWTEQHLGTQPATFQARFRPTLAGLALAAQGGSLDQLPAGSEVRRFLGWTTQAHRRG